MLITICKPIEAEFESQFASQSKSPSLLWTVSREIVTPVNVLLSHTHSFDSWDTPVKGREEDIVCATGVCTQFYWRVKKSMWHNLKKKQEKLVLQPSVHLARFMFMSIRSANPTFTLQSATFVHRYLGQSRVKCHFTTACSCEAVLGGVHSYTYKLHTGRGRLGHSLMAGAPFQGMYAFWAKEGSRCIAPVWAVLLCSPPSPSTFQCLLWHREVDQDGELC